MDQLTLFAPERRASPSPSPDLEADWLTRVATSRLSILEFLSAFGPAGWSGRTSLGCCRIEAGRLVPSSEGWPNSGMGSPTEFLTLDTSECPSAAVECSLSDILETGDVPQRFFLSARACAGILRRAKKRGKVLPASLSAALRAASTARTGTP